ncbi:hypothetical protein ACOMHN_021040 [Nucella lapillus]
MRSSPLYPLPTPPLYPILHQPKGTHPSSLGRQIIPENKVTPAHQFRPGVWHRHGIVTSLTQAWTVALVSFGFSSCPILPLPSVFLSRLIFISLDDRSGPSVGQRLASSFSPPSSSPSALWVSSTNSRSLLLVLFCAVRSAATVVFHVAALVECGGVSGQRLVRRVVMFGSQAMSLWGVKRLSVCFVSVLLLLPL